MSYPTLLLHMAIGLPNEARLSSARYLAERFDALVIGSAACDPQPPASFAPCRWPRPSAISPSTSTGSRSRLGEKRRAICRWSRTARSPPCKRDCYEADGSLTPRSVEGAVIKDADTAVAQAVQIATKGNVDIRAGGTLDLHADTICVHGDRPDAALFARKLREGFKAAGVEVTKFAG